MGFFGWYFFGWYFFWMVFYEWITLINECEVGEIDAQVGDARRVTSDDDDVNVGFWEG